MLPVSTAHARCSPILAAAVLACWGWRHGAGDFAVRHFEREDEEAEGTILNATAEAAYENSSEGKEAAVELKTEHLAKIFGSFMLTGNREASMRDINGGRLCVGGWGKEPGYYDLTGEISLLECARIANTQQNTVGFRWGRESFDMQEYHTAAMMSDIPRPVDLNKLFGHEKVFTCAIYVRPDSSTGKDPEFDGNISILKARHFAGAGSDQVCYQRVSMSHFFYTSVNELWFCYMHQSALEACEEANHTKNLQGIGFVIVIVFFLIAWAWIMRDLSEFEYPLLWITKWLVCVELGLWSVAMLLRTGGDDQGPGFTCVALAMIYGAEWVILVPYRVADAFLRSSPVNMFYLLVVAFSPCLYFELMSYYSAFPLLVSKWPVFLGFVGFTVITVAHLLKRKFCPSQAVRQVKNDSNSKVEYAPMPQKRRESLLRLEPSRFF